MHASDRVALLGGPIEPSECFGRILRYPIDVGMESAQADQGLGFAISLRCALFGEAVAFEIVFRDTAAGEIEVRQIKRRLRIVMIGSKAEVFRRAAGIDAAHPACQKSLSGDPGGLDVSLGGRGQDELLTLREIVLNSGVPMMWSTPVPPSILVALVGCLLNISTPRCKAPFCGDAIARQSTEQQDVRLVRLCRLQ